MGQISHTMPSLFLLFPMSCSISIPTSPRASQNLNSVSDGCQGDISRTDCNSLKNFAYSWERECGVINHTMLGERSLLLSWPQPCSTSSSQLFGPPMFTFHLPYLISTSTRRNSRSAVSDVCLRASSRYVLPLAFEGHPQRVLDLRLRIWQG